MTNTLTLSINNDTDELSPELWWQDTLERLRSLPAESVDVLTFDPPVDTETDRTAADDLDALLPEVMRVTHRRSTVVVHSQGTSTADIMSAWKHQLDANGQPVQEPFWRYNLVGNKTGILRRLFNANRPHEDICVFFRDQPTHTPQFA